MSSTSSIFISFAAPVSLAVNTRDFVDDFWGHSMNAFGLGLEALKKRLLEAREEGRHSRRSATLTRAPEIVPKAKMWRCLDYVPF